MGREQRGRGRRRLIAAAAVLVLASMPAVAGGQEVPDSCKTHPTKVLNPGCVPALTEDLRDWTLPNLIPLVTEVYVDRGFTGNEPPKLRFDTRAQNFGTVALELTADGVEGPTAPSVAQCVVWAAEHVCQERRTIGGFSWHGAHGHFHFEDFAAYELRSLGADGHADPTPGGLLATSQKVSFCMMDSEPRDITFFSFGYYRFCTPAMQGISAGWNDIYGAGFAGQELELSGLPDGQYALIVNMDHGNRIYETDDSDNVIEVIVEVSGNLTAARIVSRSMR